jgi:UPF0755 protein
MGLSAALLDLRKRGVIRNVRAMRIWGVLTRRATRVRAGTYTFRGGLTAGEVFDLFEHPVFLMVRIPETNWASRTSRLLAQPQYQVCDSQDYMSLVKAPQSFASEVNFPLPNDSLEGYLYPDTYELAPLMGARGVVLRQLKAFQAKIYDAFGKPKDLNRLLTLASMVQLEAGGAQDRYKIAGVIENRLAKHMRLQIDATLLYGIQKWRRLTFKDYRTLDTPYNTYLHDGLPPGPICSPDADSVAAAIHPDRTGDYLFYVALPGGKTLFAKSFAEHKRNIRLRNAMKKAMMK